MIDEQAKLELRNKMAAQLYIQVIGGDAIKEGKGRLPYTTGECEFLASESIQAADIFIRQLEKRP